MNTVRKIPKPTVQGQWKTVFLTAMTAAVGLFIFCGPAESAFELPEGEKITNPIVIGRGIPQKEAYEPFDPKIGRNFDLRNIWMRADLRVRPEYRNNVCFGGGIGAAGECNAAGIAPNSLTGKANDQFVQQMTRLGIGYDLSSDVNFYLEFIDSRTWGGNGTPVGAGGAGNNGDPIIHTCGSTPSQGGRPVCSLGIRAGYMLIRNFAGIQGLGLKAGRQYIVFGDQSLFGHFDWANTGFSFDGVMVQHSHSIMDTHAGWFRTAETDLLQGAPLGSGNPNIGGTGQARNAAGDADLFIFYNQIKTVPGFLIEPFYVYYKNNLGGGRYLFSRSRHPEARQSNPPYHRRTGGHEERLLRCLERSGLSVRADGGYRRRRKQPVRGSWRRGEMSPHQCLGHQKLVWVYRLQLTGKTSYRLQF